MAPAPLMAKSAVCHSGRFVENSPTRSPGFTPNSTNAEDNPATRRRNSSDDTASHWPARRTLCARGFGRWSTAFRRREVRSEEHTSELQSRRDLVCRLLLEKKKKNNIIDHSENDKYK